MQTELAAEAGDRFCWGLDRADDVLWSQLAIVVFVSAETNALLVQWIVDFAGSAVEERDGRFYRRWIAGTRTKADACFNASDWFRIGKNDTEHIAIGEVDFDEIFRLEVFGQEEILIAEDAAERRVDAVARLRARRQFADVLA